MPAAEKPTYLDRTWERVREEAAQGRQTYVVCPRIGGDGPAGDGPADEAAAGRSQPAEVPLALAMMPETTPAAPPTRSGARRSRSSTSPPSWSKARWPGCASQSCTAGCPPDEKDRVMLAFAAGSVDVLVTTTVVEVGVDVPNATAMVIMDADRFGVSQLHQLRGRVGRGSHEGLCLLVTEAEAGSPSRQRLDAVAATLDGFKLSRLDLEQRREGDVLGAAQAGRKSSLKLLTLLADEDLIGRARREATDLVDADPALAGQPALAAAVARAARTAAGGVPGEGLRRAAR